MYSIFDRDVNVKKTRNATVTSSGFDLYRDLSMRVQHVSIRGSVNSFECVRIFNRTFSLAVLDTLVEDILYCVRQDCVGCRHQINLDWKTHDICLKLSPVEWITVKKYNKLVIDRLDIFEIISRWSNKFHTAVKTLSDSECSILWEIITNFLLSLRELKADFFKFWTQQLVNHFTHVEVPTAPMLSSNYSGNASPERKTIPLLQNVSYKLYKIACSRLVGDWINGQIGTGYPTEGWEFEFIMSLYTCILIPLSASEEAEVKNVYELLVKKNVPLHLQRTTSHRKWIRKIFQFCEMIGVQFPDSMICLIKKHDMSQFTPAEMLGFSLKFDNDGNTRSLDTQEEREWQISLKNHRNHNPYSDHENDFVTEDVLMEWLIDFLAIRAERDLKNDAALSIEKLMNIDANSFSSFKDTDRIYATEILHDWTMLATAFINECSDNFGKLHDLFEMAVES